MRENIRHLAWGIVFCSWSLTINLFGAVVIDFLPDIVGVVFFWHFLTAHGGRQPLHVRLCFGFAVIYALGLIFPLYLRWPAAADAVFYWGGSAWALCLLVLLRRCFALLEQLTRDAGREDLAASARRFGRILTVLYAVRTGLYLAGVAQMEEAMSLVWIGLNLLLAGFAANCRVIAPKEAPAET